MDLNPLSTVVAASFQALVTSDQTTQCLHTRNTVLKIQGDLLLNYGSKLHKTVYTIYKIGLFWTLNHSHVILSYPDLLTYFSRALDLRWFCKCSKFSKKSTSGSDLLASFDRSCNTGCRSLHSRA